MNEPTHLRTASNIFQWPVVSRYIKHRSQVDDFTGLAASIFRKAYPVALDCLSSWLTRLPQFELTGGLVAGPDRMLGYPSLEHYIAFTMINLGTRWQKV